MQRISSLVLPLIVLFIIFYGLKKKLDIYDIFVDGSKESFDMLFKLFPTLLAMILGVNIFLKSGVLDFFIAFFKPFFNIVGVPYDIVPLALMRPISGSSGIAFLNSILEKYGVDSFISKMASVVQGSTDTTFYILSLYFGSIGIKKTRYALFVGLFSDLIGIVSAIVICKIFL